MLENFKETLGKGNWVIAIFMDAFREFDNLN